MTINNSDILSRAAADAEAWVAEVATNLGVEDRARGYSALRAVLHSIRDFLPFDEALRLAHQLPVVLGGLYFEGWAPGKRPGADPSNESFLSLVAERLSGLPDLDPDDAVDAVFRVLQVRLPGEMKAGESHGWSLFFPTSESKPEKSAEREVEDAVDRAVREGAPAEELPAIIDKRRPTERKSQGPGGSVFAPALQKANLWLKDLMENLGLSDRRHALFVFEAVLHSLRDRVPRDEALHFGAQLPGVLRGYYFEGWTADPDPSQERVMEDFRTDVIERLLAVPGIDLDEAIRGVFRLLSDKITAGEVQDIRGRLPQALHDQWPLEWIRPEPLAHASGGEKQSRVRKARKEIRAIIARSRARGARPPVLASRRSLRSNKRGPAPSK